MERLIMGPSGSCTPSRTGGTRLPRRTLGSRSVTASLAVASLFAMGLLLAACGPTSEAGSGVEACKDPVSTCVLSNGMSLQTRSAPAVLTPIDVTVRDVTTSVTSVRLEASMAGMSMPPVGIDLRGSGPSEWSGQLILPVCSQGRSDWQWTLVTRVGNGEQRTTVQVEAGQR